MTPKNTFDSTQYPNLVKKDKIKVQNIEKVTKIWVPKKNILVPKMVPSRLTQSMGKNEMHRFVVGT